ncbi:hypothetical protein BDW02DRAFT_300079 [Decorospora gaudefroyi]|uniref:Secreted protein n=1 Tax=Decorospora gaudefroyi TaxID=184978 RepID=A0A6A5KI25_9PLEO|nr:hypothetical protein BDW02DRAFT_300079 [Decorospora gaudefroyi]
MLVLLSLCSLSTCTHRTSHPGQSPSVALFLLHVIPLLALGATCSRAAFVGLRSAHPVLQPKPSNTTTDTVFPHVRVTLSSLGLVHHIRKYPSNAQDEKAACCHAIRRQHAEHYRRKSIRTPHTHPLATTRPISLVPENVTRNVPRGTGRVIDQG